MKFHSLRTSLIGCAFALFAAVMLGSCGGGGASGTNQGGNLVLLPQSGTFFAGMPATMTVVGGRRPYRIVSSEPGILPVPSEVNGNSFTVIPNNPGVIDSGITEGQLPLRTILVSVTDAENGFQQSEIRVAQNFLTGYGLNFISNCPLPSGSQLPPQACAGGETTVRVEANFNGSLIGFRTYRLETVRGPITWLHPDNTTGNSVTVTTDHEGKTFAVFRVNNNIESQVAIIRLVDVATGVSTEHVVPVVGNQLASELEIIPDEFTFTGPNTAACGTGSAGFLVFDGQPPYTAFSSFAQVTVTPTQSNDQPGRFQFSVNDPNTCLSNATIVVTDARNIRGTVTITTEPGTADPPPPPLRAIPSTITLTCAILSGSTLIAGGADPTAPVTSSESDPNLSTVDGPRNVTVTFTPPSGGVTASGGTVTTPVSVTDGAQVIVVSVRHPADCI